MWTRAELKERGKINFKKMYSRAVIVCIIFYLVVMVFDGGGNSASGSIDNTITYNYETDIDDSGIIAHDVENEGYLDFGFTEDTKFYFGPSSSTVIGNVSDALINAIKNTFTGITSSVLLIIMLGLLIINIALYTFIVHPITIGKNNFFMGSREGERKIGDMFFLYKESKFVKPSITMFFVNLYTLLWTLLFIIPGIVKAYEYYMIQYILSENPDIDRNRAFEISKDMMDGQKMNTFVLDLSFLGWDILSIFTFGLLGIFYVNPYRESTYAELYGVLRENTLQSGFASENELPGFNK